MTCNKGNITIATLGIQIAARQKETKCHRVTARRQKAGLHKAFVQIKLKHRHRNVTTWQAVGPLLVRVEGGHLCQLAPQSRKVVYTESMRPFWGGVFHPPFMQNAINGEGINTISNIYCSNLHPLVTDWWCDTLVNL